MPWMGSMVFTMVGATIGFTGWPLVTMVTSVTLGGPHDLGHHQGVRLIFQSCYGVGVTFRVAPMWVKCMFCPSLTRKTHSKLQEKEKGESHPPAPEKFLYARFEKVVCFGDTGSVIDEGGNNGL